MLPSGDATPTPAESIRQALLESVYREIRTIASRAMSLERANHTLQPTALAHEAYLRLQASSAVASMPRHELLALATTVIRNVLIDHARTRRSLRRGGVGQQVSLDQADSDPCTVELDGTTADLLEVDAAIVRLADVDTRKATVVQLRFFGGMTNDEIATHLGVTARTVTNDWNYARAWLRRELLHAAS